MSHVTPQHVDQLSQAIVAHGKAAQRVDCGCTSTVGVQCAHAQRLIRRATRALMVLQVTHPIAALERVFRLKAALAQPRCSFYDGLAVMPAECLACGWTKPLCAGHYAGMAEHLQRLHAVLCIKQGAKA